MGVDICKNKSGDVGDRGWENKKIENGKKKNKVKIHLLNLVYFMWIAYGISILFDSQKKNSTLFDFTFISIVHSDTIKEYRTQFTEKENTTCYKFVYGTIGKAPAIKK